MLRMDALRRGWAGLLVAAAMAAAGVTAAAPAAAADPGCVVAPEVGRDDRQAALGVFRDGTWYVRGSLTSGPADLCFVFGQAGDQPVFGDWDGDGLPTPGVFRASTGTWYLSNAPFAQSGADVVVQYGSPGDLAYMGDFDADGVTTVGVYRPGEQRFYLRNSNTSGIADGAFRFGQPGDQPAPDPQVNGLRVYRPSDAAFVGAYLTGPEPGTAYSWQFGNPGDVPLWGPWETGGTALGGWNAQAAPGVYRPSTGEWLLLTDRFAPPSLPTVTVLQFGNPGDVRIGFEPRCSGRGACGELGG
ncbi:hypothetical protein [Cellulomonas sp. Y8]|uniref:hypothetical protein n=1 Tax=Cellulomonas sp. Y8 TaxID=2591145 RepID=UPI00143D67FC|nr:hypothetical protein [Cellulomonas sp. Y8]